MPKFTPLSIRSLPETSLRKLLTGNEPSACRGPRFAVKSSVTKSAALTVTAKFHELKVCTVAEVIYTNEDGIDKLFLRTKATLE